MTLRSSDSARDALPAWLERICVHPRLPWLLASVGVSLAAHSLWMGFHLDDYIHRYLLSDLPGAADLLRAYESPFGVANGERAINRWQVEHGVAPWWIDRDLLVSLWRPLSTLSHRLDATLWPDNAFLMHAHNLCWFAALIAVVTRLYQQVFVSRAGAGLAALFYAVSHTNGFAVGWIANRNALIAAFLGALSLLLYERGTRGNHLSWWLSIACWIAALLSGEGSLAVLGYTLSHALFLDQRSLRTRVLSMAPMFVIAVAWRVAYTALGHGAHGSGLYLDPAREPMAFAAACVTRLPLLIMGQFAFPPAEGYVLGPPAWAPFVLGFAWVVTALFLLAVVPLARVDRHARFWLGGMPLALILNCTTYANNRLLFFVGLGAMALLAQLWTGHLAQAAWLPTARVQRALSHLFVGAAALLHLLLSPLLLPLSTQSVAFTRPIHPALEPLVVDPSLAQRELLFLNAPEYFYVKLIPVLRALSHAAPVPAIHALSFGPVATRIERVDARTLHVHYEGGILQDITSQLYRRSDLPMGVGERFDYGEVEVEVLGVEPDGRAHHVRFSFSRDLDDPTFRIMRWNETAFVDVKAPGLGQTLSLSKAPLPLKIP